MYEQPTLTSRQKNPQNLKTHIEDMIEDFRCFRQYTKPLIFSHPYQFS